MKIAIVYKKCPISKRNVFIYLSKHYWYKLFNKKGINYSLSYNSMYLKYLTTGEIHLWNTGLTFQERLLKPNFFPITVHKQEVYLKFKYENRNSI